MMPDVHPPSQETSDEVFQANHSIQNEESYENHSNKIAISNFNQEKEEPAQESDIHQLIEECSTKVSEEQNDLIESALNSKLLLINSNSQHLEKEQQEVKNVVEQPAERGNHITPILSTKEPGHLLSMGYEHLIITHEIESDEATESNAENLVPILSECEVTLEDKRECDLPISKNSPVCDNHSDIFFDSKIDDDISVYDDDFKDIDITPEMESDEATESNAENLVPILSECEVTLEDKRECDLPISKNSPVCDNHSDIFFDSKIDDDISVYDDDFEDIEYVEASLSDPEIISVEEENDVEEENVVQQEEEEVDLEDISQIQDVVLREKLLSITRLISNIESLNNNSTPDHVLNSFEYDNSLSDNFSPEFETFCDHTEETRS
nr:hypothetical protein [Tanacetum cinerariifolium]